MRIKKASLLLWIALLSGCAALTRHTLDEQFGRPDPARFDTPRAPGSGSPTAPTCSQFLSGDAWFAMPAMMPLAN
jgi:hypothetical protein